MIRRFLAALQFLTIAPVRTELDVADIGRSVPYFPLVGVLMGIVLALADALVFERCFPPAVTAVLGVLALAATSGGLHLDGVADTADGFFSSRPKERILEIMRDSRIGTMGALALFAILALKVSALASMSPSMRCWALLLAPVAGRCMLVVAMTRAPYARADGGLATIYLSNRKPWHSWAALAILAVVAGLVLSWYGLAIAAACVAVTAAFNAYARRKIGGITGDTLGAVCELAETVVMLAVLEIPQ